MAQTFILFDKGKKHELGRLHVGYRASDWTKVWYKPDPNGEADEDGFIALKLYKLSAGAEQRREPMMGEVVWLPHFNIKQFASESKREKERLHAQYLHDAWRYLSETDHDQVRQLEEELDDPKRRHWQAWFDEAKKWKAGRIRQRGKRRAARNALATSSGYKVGEVEVTSDTSDDSAYETEEDLFVRDKPMRPPPLPTSAAKRKAAENGDRRPAKRSPNKPKSSSGGSAEDFPMSGGLGGIPFGSNTNIAGLDDHEGDDQDDNASRGSNGSFDFDNRSPEPGLPDRSAIRSGNASKSSPSAQLEARRAAMRNQFRQPTAAGAAIDEAAGATVDEARARRHNGDVGEEEGVQRAIRESTQDVESRRNANQNISPNGENGTGEDGTGELCLG